MLLLPFRLVMFFKDVALSTDYLHFMCETYIYIFSVFACVCMWLATYNACTLHSLLVYFLIQTCIVWYICSPALWYTRGKNIFSSSSVTRYLRGVNLIIVNSVISKNPCWFFLYSQQLGNWNTIKWSVLLRDSMKLQQ